MRAGIDSRNENLIKQIKSVIQLGFKKIDNFLNKSITQISSSNDKLKNEIDNLKTSSSRSFRSLWVVVIITLLLACSSTSTLIYEYLLK